MSIIKLADLLLLSEGRYGKPRSKIISHDDTINLLKTDHSSAYKAYLENNKIYRGLDDRDYDFLYIKPSVSDEERTSRFALGNYYTALMITLPSWKSYPKRNKSIICTTETSKAFDYSGSYAGAVYIVLPKNNSKIAISSDDDIFYSFNYVYERLGVDSANGFNRLIENMLYDFNLGNYTQWNENNIDVILKLMDKDVVMKQGERYRTATHRLLSDIHNSNYTSWKDYFNDLLDPVKNGFKLTTIENYKRLSDKEVWTDGDSLLIKIEKAYDILYKS